MAVKIDTNARIEKVRFQDQTSHPSAPSAGYSWLYRMTGTGQSGLFVEDDAGRKIGPLITGTSASSANPWELVVNQDGTSFASWTATAGGTWTSDGTVIKQTDTAATRRRAYFNTKVINSILVVQADIQLKSSGGDNRGGFLMGFDGTNSGSACAVFISENNSVQVEVDAAANKYNHSVTINVDTWYTLRAIYTGHSVSVYLDGTLLFTAGGTVQALNTADYIGLLTYQAEVWFRNIKAWNLTMPS